MEAKIHPIEISKLRKGMYIDPKEIADIYGVKTNDPNFWSYQLRLKEFIEKRSALRCKCSKGGLRVLTDLENDEYQWGHSQKAVRRLVRCATDSALIDTSEFTDERKRVADQRQRVHQVVALVATKTRQKAIREKELFGPKEATLLLEGELKEGE